MEKLPSELLDNDLVGAQEALDQVSDAEVAKKIEKSSWHTEQERLAAEEFARQHWWASVVEQGEQDFAEGRQDQAFEVLEMALWDARHNRKDHEAERALEIILERLRKKAA